MKVDPSIKIDTLVALQESASELFHPCTQELPAVDCTSNDSQRVAQQEKVATPENVATSSSDSHDHSA